MLQFNLESLVSYGNNIYARCKMRDNLVCCLDNIPAIHGINVYGIIISCTRNKQSTLVCCHLYTFFNIDMIDVRVCTYCNQATLAIASMVRSIDCNCSSTFSLLLSLFHFHQPLQLKGLSFPKRK